MAGVKTRINANQASETANEQAGAREKNQSQAQLRYNEGLSCEGATVCGVTLTVALVNVLLDTTTATVPLVGNSAAVTSIPAVQ